MLIKSDLLSCDTNLLTHNDKIAQIQIKILFSILQITHHFF